MAAAQYVPNTGSVKPPEAAHCQLSLPKYATGSVVQIVAASFQARHAAVSPVLKGYVPPRLVAAVVLYPAVVQSAMGDAHPW